MKYHVTLHRNGSRTIMTSPRYPKFDAIGAAVVDLALVCALLPKLCWFTVRVALLTLNNARLRRELEFHHRRLIQ